MTRPPIKTPMFPLGANACMKVAMMTRKAPAAIPARLPAKSANGPPKNHPATIAPTIYEVLIAPYRFKLDFWTIVIDMSVEAW
jgi:hypothetical protein